MHLRTRDERGSMLIVALGILTLLSVLALTFVSIMRLEQNASKNYVEAVKARLIAEGGLEHTMAQLKVTVSGESFSDPDADWIYANGNYWLPLEKSSALRKGDPDDLNPGATDEIRASFAGTLGQSYAGGDDRYKVKVIDTQTQFNLNSNYEVIDGLDQTYIRFLDALGVAIANRTESAPGLPVGRNPIQFATYPKGSPNAWRGGEAIYRFRQSREGKKFNTKTELLEVLENEDDYILVRDYVTTRSWFDPKTVTARSQTLQGASGNPQTTKAWSDVTKQDRRSPVNVNLATPEIIAANLAGIAARGIFTYTGDFSTRDQRLQRIDEGTTFEFGNAKEETAYGVTPVLVYFDPFGFQPGQQPNDPPAIHGAELVARMIHQRIHGTGGSSTVGSGPFKTFAEWEDWVDRAITDGLIQNTRDPDTGDYVFPRPDTARLFHLNESLLTANPSEADIRGHPRFKAWFYDAVRSMLKANFNPNARLSGWNPNATTYMPVDKGGLLYFVDPNNPASTKARHQTNEWCFSSKGIFEIISLGEVLGPPPADVTKGTEKVLFAQAKVRGILQLYDTITHTTQRDFERNAKEFELERGAIASYPVPKIYWDPRALSPPLGSADVDQDLDEGGDDERLHGSELDGFLEVSTVAEPGDTKWVEMGQPTFELLLQDRRVEDPTTGDPLHRDSLMADRSGGSGGGANVLHNQNPGFPMQGRISNAWGWPFGDATAGVSAPTRSSTEQESWRWDILTPDGYLNSEVRKTLLWYRANDINSRNLPANGRPDGRLRGESQDQLTDGGNVAPTPRGGVEFWYKPEFDWSVRTTRGPGSQILNNGGQQVPDGRYCGLMAVSHVMPNPTGVQGGGSNQPGSWTRGTQMFMTRNTSGEIRVTRLFYEVVGPTGHPQEEPLVRDPHTGNPIKFTEYFNKAATDFAYVWPPAELLSVAGTPFERIRWARNDYWVPYQELRDWRANEWHHIAVYWDDYADTGNIKLWLDGLPVTNLIPRTPPLGDRYEPFFADPSGGPLPIAYSDYEAQTGSPPPVSLLDGKLPSFVRLNQLTGPSTPPSGQTQAQYEEGLWPKDQVVVGAIRRDQAVMGGLFKHDKDAVLPANGTIDDFRFYDGTQAGPSTNRPTQRYEFEGNYTNEFDLSPYFPLNVDEIELSGISFTSYLPPYFADEEYRGTNNGSVELVVEIRRSDGSIEALPTWTTTFQSLVDDCSFQFMDAVGQPVTLRRGDQLVYMLNLLPATKQTGSFTGQAVMSPTVDAVDLVYNLPNARVLLKERVNN